MTRQSCNPLARMAAVMRARVAAAALCLFMAGTAVRAQELTPNAYSPVPIGANLLLLTNNYSTGSISLDPSLPVKDVTATINTTIAVLWSNARTERSLHQYRHRSALRAGRGKRPDWRPGAVRSAQGLWRSGFQIRHKRLRRTSVDAQGVCKVPPIDHRRSKPGGHSAPRRL